MDLYNRYMDEFLEFWAPVIMIVIGFLVLIVETLGKMRAAYGRYNTKNHGLSAPIAWLVQECPAFFVPFVLLIYRHVFLFDKENKINTNFILLSFFMIHYFNR